MSELCSQWSVLALDVSLKVLLLAVVTACGIRLLRIRRSNLKHAAWLGVLAGMIGLPWLSYLLPSIPVPIGLGPAAAPAAPVASAVNALPKRSVDARLQDDPTGWGWRRPSDPEMVSPVMHDMAGPSSSRESVTFAQSSQASRFVFRWPVVAFTIWALGVLTFGARLALALLITRQIVRRSTTIADDDPRLESLGQAVPANIGLRESSDISVPLTTGIWHPHILLPTDWNEWPAEKLSDVLMHECAHIRRRDCCTALAAGAMASVYWLHPLSWWLRRRLAVLAEDCCDDAAIAAAGERAVYARHLLEIASVLCHERRRLHYVALSMARQSNVERRILSILDTSRPLSQRLPWSLTLLLAAVILPLVAVAAALKPAEEPRAANDSQEKTAAAQPSSDKAKASPEAKPTPPAAGTENPRAPKPDDRAQAAPSDTEEKAYQGKVVDADGRPMAGVEIWFSVSPYETPSKPAQNAQNILRQVAASDSNGEFSFRLKPLVNTEEFPLAWRQFAALVAKAPGHGCDWLPLQVFEENPTSSEKRSTLERNIDEFLGRGRFASRTLKLPRQAGPVRGRLIDLEGRPLKGVAVSVEQIQYADLTKLREGFETASRDTVNRSFGMHNMPRGSLNRRDCQALVPPVKTDDNGEFSLSGLGRDQVATVTLLGNRVEAERFFILGTEMEIKRVPHISLYPKGAQDAFVGVNFTLAVGPAIPVSGVVTEFKTGKPIANAVVYVERLFSRESLDDSLVQLRLLTNYIRAVTDEQGRYQLEGIPPGEGHILKVVPPKSEPWLMASQTISLDPGQPAANVNIQVFRGIWIEGQVTDADTGEGVEGFVDYLALKKNPNIPQAFGLQDSWETERFPIAAEGRYRTAGLPGPGVLLVRSYGEYPRSVGAEKIKGYNPNRGYLPTTPGGAPLSNWHLVQFIDPGVDAKSYHCDLTLSAGASLVGRIVGPNDAPLSRIEALGLVEKGEFFKPLTDDKFTVVDYQPEVPRSLFFKTADRALVGYLHLEGAPPADLTVRLKPSVTVRGQLIEMETDEPAAEYHVYCASSKQGKFRIDDTLTDKEGRFEIKGLVAGNIYEMNAANVQAFVNGKNRFTIDLSDAKPGDVVELGEVTGKNAKRKE